MEVEPTASDEDALHSAVECTRVGVSVVELWTYSLSTGILLDRRFKPCWSQAMEDPDATLGGPAVPPGPYAVIARGLRSNGEPWTFCEFVDGEEVCGPITDPRVCVEGPEGPECDVGTYACDCAVIDVVEDETVHIRDLVLEPPPECEDGIDSDGDGLVDQLDPGCQVAGVESADIVSAQLVFNLSFLSRNDAATCIGVGVAGWEFFVDDELVADVPCFVGVSALPLDLEPGPHEFRIRGVGNDPAAGDDNAITETKAFAVEALSAGVLMPSELVIDFADGDFLEPIVTPVQFTPGFSPHPDDTVRTCSPVRGSLELTQMTASLVDAGGRQVQPAPRLVNGADAGARLNGGQLDCANQFLLTDDVRWGSYGLVLEAFSADGELCYSNADAPELLAPGTNIGVTADRVWPVPDSCRDCDNDVDCGPTFICDAGACVPEVLCIEDTDCLPDEVCPDGRCIHGE